MHTPSTWTAAHVNDFAKQMSENPTSVFNAAFIALYPEITGIEVTVTSALPKRAGLTMKQQIGIGIGVGAGVPLVAGAIAFAVWRRRQRMVVEPRTALRSADQLA